MKMPDVIAERFFAPCGMNCMVCYVHLKEKKPCDGCLGNDLNKPERCKNCAIKNCAGSKNLVYCYECSEYPCKSIKNLEKSYTQRYNASLIKNGSIVKEQGLIAFQASERIKWSCKKCGGVVSLHDGVCSDCGEKHESYSGILKNKAGR